MKLSGVVYVILSCYMGEESEIVTIDSKDQDVFVKVIKSQLDRLFGYDINTKFFCTQVLAFR